jgi:hypothetical protein
MLLNYWQQKWARFHTGKTTSPNHPGLSFPKSEVFSDACHDTAAGGKKKCSGRGLNAGARKMIRCDQSWQTLAQLCFAIGLSIFPGS